MRAVAIIPGKKDSAHLIDIPKPNLSDFEKGNGVLVEVIRVGACGTDREINNAEYGIAPKGSNHLVIGHENLGRVVEVGENVTDLKEGDYVVATVRRPYGSSIYDKIQQQDFTTDDKYWERGISRLNGFWTEFYSEEADFLVTIPPGIIDVAVLLEPLSIIEKGFKQAEDIQRRLAIWHPKKAAVLGTGNVGLLASVALRLRGFEVHGFGRQLPNDYLNAHLLNEIGATYDSTNELSIIESVKKYGEYDLIFECTGYSPITFEAMQCLNENGILILASVTGGNRKTDNIPTDKINKEFVLGNRVMVGTVNASLEHFSIGVGDIALAESMFPGWLKKLLTNKVVGLENFAKVFDILNNGSRYGAIKTYLELKPLK